MIKNQLSTLVGVVAKRQVIIACHRFLKSTFRLSTGLRPRRWVGLLLTLNFSFLFLQCGLDIEDPTPPSPPTWIQKSFPEDWPERGIDAHESGGIYLEWLPNLNEYIIAYVIMRGEYNRETATVGELEIIEYIDQSFGEILEFLDTEIGDGKLYCYTIIAVNSSQIESNRADTLSYKLHRPIEGERMFPNGSTDTLPPSRVLSWRNYDLDEAEDYCLTILSSQNEFIFRRLLQPQTYVGGVETWSIAAEIELVDNQIYKWRIDTGAEYVDQIETAGSESPWATFIYIDD